MVVTVVVVTVGCNEPVATPTPSTPFGGVRGRVVERGFRRVVIVVTGTAIAATLALALLLLLINFGDGDVVVVDVTTSLSTPSEVVITSPVVVAVAAVMFDDDHVGDDGNDTDINPSVAIDNEFTPHDNADDTADVVVTTPAIPTPLSPPTPSPPAVDTAPVTTTGTTAVVAPLDGCFDEGRVGVGVVYTLTVGEGGRKCFLSGTQP